MALKLKRKLAAALAAAGLAAGLSVAATGTARASIPLPPSAGQYYGIFNPYLHARINTLCFEDPGGSTANGTRVQLNECHQHNSDGTLQRWGFVQAADSNGNPITEGGNNVYKLFNLAAGECLGVRGTSDGQPLLLESCNPNDGSVVLWELRPTSAFSPDFQLAVYMFAGWCIAANDASDNRGTPLGLFECNPSDTKQLWNLG
jgi:hypothetical protein